MFLLHQLSFDSGSFAEFAGPLLSRLNVETALLHLRAVYPAAL